MTMQSAPTTSLLESCVDQAESAGFIQHAGVLESFDPRTEQELQEVARDHRSAMERERALWEYAHRRSGDSIPLLADALRCEPEPSVRWNLLWLALKVGKSEAFPLLQAAALDEHRDVRDWANLFLSEVTGTERALAYAEGAFTERGPFDQTLPLQISGFALVQTPELGTVRATLSPLWFEHLLGRVLACTNQATFMKDLTIEKRLKGYHRDGSDHHEIFPFSGVSWPVSDRSAQHCYESMSVRPFYTSGRVEDRSAEVVNVPVILNRKATTSLTTLNVFPSDDPRFTTLESLARPAPTDLATETRGIRLLNGKIVSSVRGQFFGWAHTSIRHYLEHGEVLPGTVQLANPTHEVTRGFVNTYLGGTFRGKLSDWDGDGRADVNLIPCHGTPDGQLDDAADGTRQPDPFA